MPPARRLFTVAEVEALLPRLTELMGAAMERYARAGALSRRLDEERASIGAGVEPRDWAARAERLDGLTIEVRAAVEAVQALGGAVKDLGLGLVDFPGLVPERGDEPVNLCWRHGETAVRWWHGLDEGYAQRKALP